MKTNNRAKDKEQDMAKPGISYRLRGFVYITRNRDIPSDISTA